MTEIANKFIISVLWMIKIEILKVLDLIISKVSFNYSSIFAFLRNIKFFSLI